jgi:iron complex transport system permease protein
MMVVASVLTAVCVAFVGIIGFVGLVIPHACRMALGGDHRLIMPASIVLGAMLMLFADLLARTVISPLELPVGAITAMIGTPVFAYMLMKKGREYNG